MVNGSLIALKGENWEKIFAFLNRGRERARRKKIIAKGTGENSNQNKR